MIYQQEIIISVHLRGSVQYLSKKFHFAALEGNRYNYKLLLKVSVAVFFFKCPRVLKLDSTMKANCSTSYNLSLFWDVWL